MERSSGSFRRTIQLPAGLDPDNVQARFKRGTLTVTLPKLPKARGTRRNVAIQDG